MSDPLKSRLDWIVSYPKSGNTWVRLLLAAYVKPSPTDVRFEIDIGPYLFGAVSSVPVERMTLEQQIQVRGAALLGMAHYNRGARTLVKSHHTNGSMHGVRTFSPLWTQRIIYVVRDPRDIAPSWAHHTGKSLEETVEAMGESNTRIEDIERGSHAVGSWSDHVRSFAGEEGLDVLIVRYEDMQEDTGRELARIVEHLELGEVDTERVERAVERTSFERVREAEDSVGFPEATDNGRFFRRGEAGAWRDEVPPHLVARIEEKHGDQMAEMGYHPARLEAVK